MGEGRPSTTLPLAAREVVDADFVGMTRRPVRPVRQWGRWYEQKKSCPGKLLAALSPQHATVFSFSHRRRPDHRGVDVSAFLNAGGSPYASPAPGGSPSSNRPYGNSVANGLNAWCVLPRHERTIDHQNDRYFEKVTMSDTGEVIHP
jgi:hypothetical protein